MTVTFHTALWGNVSSFEKPHSSFEIERNLSGFGHKFALFITFNNISCTKVTAWEASQTPSDRKQKTGSRQDKSSGPSEPVNISNFNEVIPNKGSETRKGDEVTLTETEAAPT